MMPVKFVNGATIFLKDVAQVRDGSLVQQNVVRENGRRSVLLSVIKNGNASTLAVVNGVKEALKTARAAAPAGLKIDELFDQSVFVTSSVTGLLREGAIAAGGRTIGVLGCGIDKIYPPENRRLFQEMAEKGGLVSEFPLGTLPLAENFPRRNRIISGLSRGVLVVEATENSGSLITAQYALEHGRDVYAVPGNISFATSRGSNRLIKQGAKLVDCVEDILEELPGFGNRSVTAGAQVPAPRSFSLTPKEAAIYELLARSPLHIDEIITQTELTAAEVSTMLLHLELKGAVMPLPGTHYAIAG